MINLKQLKMLCGALFTVVFCAVSISVNAQSAGFVSKKVIELKEKNVFTRQYSLFSVVQPNAATATTVNGVVTKSTFLALGGDLGEVVNNAPEFLRFNVPVDNGARILTVLLYKSEITADNFRLLTSDGSVHRPDKIVNYRGCLSNNSKTVASFTFAEGESMGMISGDDGNYVIGKMSDNSGLYIVYNDINLIPQSPFNCGTVADYSKNNSAIHKQTVEIASTKCVNMYWETDYDLYTGKGNDVTAVNTYIQGAFNQMATLYANDGVSVALKTVYVWTTADPYTGPSTSNFLDQFGATRTSFNGDLATLVGYAGGGGIAYVGTLCMSVAKYKMAYCGIGSTYSTVPTYSWTVEVLTHENGHLLGSNHTHDCAWNGNNTKIDDCGGSAGYSSGTCAPEPSPANPIGGGTIMSYCHLTSVGIKFSLGFGPQPAALILNNVNNASCLLACGCTTPSQPGSISGNAAICASTSNTYSVTAVGGATSYTWTLPSGWSGTSTTNSITATAGSTSGSVTVKANNSCGSSAAATFSVTVTALPAKPSAISGSASVCAAVSSTYSVTAAAGATSYTWTLPSGWSGASTTNAITVTTGSTGGSITVKSNNSCGISATTSLTTTVTAAPAQPGAVSGNATVCSGSSQTYSVASVSGATAYIWTLPSGWTGSSSVASVNTVAGTAGGTVSVAASNSCGTSSAQTLAVSVSTIAQPGSISGNTSVCAGTAQTYSVTAVPGATGYIWTLPAGWSGSSSTNSISATAGTSAGTVSVIATFSCGNSAASTLSVALTNAPAQPGAISGATSLCAGAVQTYSVTAVGGATAYTWTLPGGWTGSSATNSISATAGSAGGAITVTANNSCGNSAAQSLTATVTSTPAQPGSISGNVSICSGSAQTYSVTAVAGATGYIWTIPAGWSGSSSVNSITATANSADGTVTVAATNGCGTSAAQSLAVSVATVSQPGAITGTAGVCAGSSQTYSIASVAGATDYTWILPSGWTGSSTTTSITTVAGTSGGTISVTANSSCGVSGASTLSTTVTNGAPATPTTVSGNKKVGANSSQTYSVTAVAGATSYIWTLPAGWSGSSTTNSINVVVGTVGGTVSVKAVNGCGSSAASSLTVSLTGPSKPSKQISGLNLVPKGIEIYPNPSQGELTVHLMGGSGQAKVDIYNLTGQVIYSQKYVELDAAYNIKLNLENNLPGIYMLRVTDGEEVFMKKLVIEK